MFVGEGWAEALNWQRGQMNQIEQWRYMCLGALKKKLPCWKVGDPQEKQRRSKTGSSCSESCLEH